MLSRVATTLYWMLRYVERADNLARLIDVNQQLLLDTEGLDSDRLREFWKPIILCTGDEELFDTLYKTTGSRQVIRFLTDDPDNPNSIGSCIAMARENARTVRDQLPDDLWEEINSLYLFTKSDEASLSLKIDPSRYYETIRRSAFTINGIATSTVSRNQAWEFMDLGRHLERADKTTRFLDISSYLSLGEEEDMGDGEVDPIHKSPGMHWTAILRSCGAMGAFRAARHVFSADQVLGFLLFSMDFPRSVRYCLDRIDTSLHRISGTMRGTYSNEAERVSGSILARLNFGSPAQVFATGLHDYLDALQEGFNSIGSELFKTYILMPDKILTTTYEDYNPLYAAHAAANEQQMQQQQ